jgi:heme/copper-type cytochrome/quinol oxidase subunit 3
VGKGKKISARGRVTGAQAVGLTEETIRNGRSYSESVHWFLFIAAILVSLASATIAVAGFLASNAPEPEPEPEPSFWGSVGGLVDLLSGEASKKAEAEMRAQENMGGMAAWFLTVALFAGGFAIYQGVQIWG